MCGGLKITYGTRIAITILFPVALYLDLICGVVSMSISENVFQRSIETFHVAFLTTILQGLVMNAVLAVYGLLVHGIQFVFTRVTS
ncbi:MAG: hypothetical protein AAFX06_15285 [Planctomycetota bacterium]